MTYPIKNLNWRDIGLVCVLLILVFFVFSPGLQAGFINWDDDTAVTDNTQIREFSLTGLSKQFYLPQNANYYRPMILLTYSLEYKYFGLNPFIYHLDNILLHLLNVLLVFRIAYYLSSGSIAVAYLTAVFFGLHPLRVESVIWITERKDVLFSFFYLGGLLSYLSWISAEFQKNKYFWLSIFLFICAILSKPQAVSLPLLLCAIDFYYGRKLCWQTFKEKIPFFLIASSFLLINVLLLKPLLDKNIYSYYSGIEKFCIANFALVTVLFKTLFPTHLSLLYPFPEKNKIGLLPPIVLISPILVVALIAGGLYYFRKSKVFIFACLFFFITILLPLINMNYSFFFNDRYTYLPHVGFFWGVSMAILRLYGGIRQSLYKTAGGVLLAIYLVFLGIVTYQQSALWQDNILLWSDVIKKFPTVDIAYSHRGILESEAGHHLQALDDFNKAIHIKPQDFTLYNNRGYALLRATRYTEAVQDFTLAIYLKPDYLVSYRNRAEAFYDLGRYKEALDDMNVVNRIEPQSASTHYYCSIIYFRLANYGKALEEAKKAQRLNFPVSSLYFKGLLFINKEK